VFLDGQSQVWTLLNTVNSGHNKHSLPSCEDPGCSNSGHYGNPFPVLIIIHVGSMLFLFF